MNENEIPIDLLEKKVEAAWQSFLHYSRLLAERKLPKEEISQAEVHRIAGLIGRNVTHRAWQKKDEHKCLNCGQVGAHFVPPSMGEEGFYFCEKKEVKA